jgi:hypothetical protein
MEDTAAHVKNLISLFELKPLPVEGGLFRRSYISTDTISGKMLPERYEGTEHAFGSAIYALLTQDPDSFSTLHKLTTDEVYHHYLGDPVEMLLLHPGGESERIILGKDILGGERVQYVVPRGVWQGFRLKPGGIRGYALLGTTMAPGFHISDFVTGDRATLLGEYPQEAELIRSLTRYESARRMKAGDEA